MKIGILGGGNVGGTLGVAWAKQGHQIRFGVRDPKAADLQAVLAECNGQATAGSAAEAAAFGDVVMDALPWSATKGVLGSLNLQGKTLLDATNPLSPSLSGLELGTTTSGGEMVAEWAKGARVVKIFNSTGSANMANPIYNGEPIPMFYCGDDAEGKKTAASLAKDVGFSPVDAGPLTSARVLEPLALLWVSLAYQCGMGPGFAFQIVKR